MRKVIVIVDLYVANVVRALNVTYLVILRQSVQSVLSV